MPFEDPIFRWGLKALPSPRRLLWQSIGSTQPGMLHHPHQVADGIFPAQLLADVLPIGNPVEALEKRDTEAGCTRRASWLLPRFRLTMVT